jgi:hypothetical protein
MAKITPYQQGQLASSVVGTPGVNLSGAQTLGNIGSELGQLGAAQHQQYLQEVRLKQAQQRELQKHMDDMARQTKIINLASGAEVEMQKSMNELQMAHQEDPETAVAAFDGIAQQKIQASLQKETDPETNMMLQQKLAGLHASGLREMGNWQQSRQIPNAVKDLNDSAGSLSMTTGQMGGKSPQEIKSLIDTYNTNTHNAYSFYHKDGLSGQFEAGSNAVTEYLKATALTAGMANNPKILDDAVKQFMDGKYISPDKLLGIYGQQKSIAASVATAANQQKTQDDWAAFMNATHQLTVAGNGDPKAARPDVAQKILEDAASKLNPAHNIELAGMINRNNLEAKQREASEKALKMAITNKGNRTGLLKDTPPEVVKEILKIPNLSPDEREKYSKLFTGNVAAAKSQDIDKILSNSIGVAAAGATRLSYQINEDLHNLTKLQHDPVRHKAAMEQFGVNMQRYQAAYLKLHDTQDSIKDSNVKALVDLHIKNVDEEFGKYAKILQNDPDAIAAKKASDSLYGSVKPKTIYPEDSRQQQYYNYLHQQLFYNMMSTKKFSAKDMNILQNNEEARKQIQNDLAKQTASWMHQRGLTP